MNPGGVSFFAAKDAKTAKRIIWKTFHELDDEYELGLQYHLGDMVIEAPNGYSIWLLGLPDEGEADKLRGGTHGFVDGVIDECATIRSEVLKYAAINCALPALGENDGRLALTGTPGSLMSGFFFDQCQRRSNFHWDARDNPHLRFGGDRLLEQAIANNPGWTWDTPTFKREYLGIWCEDSESLVFQYSPLRNITYDAFDVGRTILGVDVGYEDGNGYCVTRSQPPNNPEIHVLRCYERTGQKLHGMAAEIEQLRRQYSVNYIFVDEGNNGKLVSKSLCDMGIPCRPTPKGPKRPRIEYIRGGLAAGTLKVLRGECDTLLGEWGMIPWNEARTDMDERYSNECSDACIYSVLPHRGVYEALLEEPEEGTGKAELLQQRRDKETEERESISAADLDRISARMNRVRSRGAGIARPDSSVIANWRRAR